MGNIFFPQNNNLNNNIDGNINNNNNGGDGNNNILNVGGEGNAENLLNNEPHYNIQQERNTMKKVIAARLPTYLRKNSLKLERDAISTNKYYIKFNYDSLHNINCFINFNVSTHNPNNQNPILGHRLLYPPSQTYSKKGFSNKKG